MDLSLNGKTALVTGSSRGTGLIIAAHLAREGATVYVHGLEPGQAQAAVDDIGVGIPVTGDIRTDAGAATLFPTGISQCSINPNAPFVVCPVALVSVGTPRNRKPASSLVLK
jgi:NAD(P)-dependent dehydrogenase (short-subunit alcohol dehydrogenase family)